jgi:hypothetical protein
VRADSRAAPARVANAVNLLYMTNPLQRVCFGREAYL